MKSSSIRVFIAYIAIILSYIGILFYASTLINESPNISNNLGGLIALFGLASVGSGIIGGLIAPYSYKALIKYLAITLCIIFLIAGILLAILGDFAFSEEGLAAIVLVILFVVLVVATVIIVVVTTAGIFVGALIGSMLGRTFQDNYELREQQTDYSDMPSLD